MRLCIIFTVFVWLLSACSQEQAAAIMAFGKVQKAPSIKNPQEVTIVTVARPDTYYLNADNHYAGLEYDLAELFSTKFAPEYKIKFLVVDNVAEVLPTLASGKADIAAAGLASSYSAKLNIRFSQPYYTTQPVLVYNKNFNKRPMLTKLGENKSLEIVAETGFSDDLLKIKRQDPDLNWLENSEHNQESLLSKVAQGKLDYTIANSHLVNLMQNFYPNLQVAQQIGEPEKVAWAFSPKADKRLILKVNQYFTSIKNNGQLRNLLDRHYGHAERLNESDITRFLNLAETVLPDYKPLFKEAASETGLNWRLLAALSYRESHWDANNTSPTNVRGIMMLTENTASELGVSDRLDPEQSIPAGAKYIARLKSLFPKTIPDQDRTYFALAAYNIGFSHVQDARILAKRLKLNPDSWADIKRTLVLLNDPKYYKTVKGGYASGGAPVIFVETVRSYQKILEKYQPSKMQILSGYFMAAK
jgi:membrane-bound lytic murein transglycosylase F